MIKSNKNQILAYLFMSILATFSLLTAASENNLNSAFLLESAEHYINERLDTTELESIKVKAMPIDARLNIPACPSPVVFSANEETLNQSNITVKTNCPDSNWYMFLSIRVTRMQSVVVISSAVSPGTVLTKQNIKVVDMDKKRLRSSTFADIEDVIGARIKRRLRPGRPVDPNNLCFVCKGDSIVIKAGSPGMQVKASGVALQDGNIGDTILVRNARSKKKIDAQVVSTNEVRVII